MNALKRSGIVFGAFGLMSVAVYGCLQPLLFRFNYHQPDNQYSASITLALCVLVCCYVSAQYSRWLRDVSIRWIVLFALLFVSLMFFSLPNGDVLDYLNMGWLQSHQHLNPYRYAVTDVSGWQNDPMFRQTVWFAHPTVYGFLFAAFMKWLTALARGDWQAALVLYRTSVVVSFLASAWLLWRTHVDTDAALAKLSVLSFLWSPLILIFHVGYGHNDLLMSVFSLGALYCLLKGRWLWPLPLLTLAMLVKLGAVVGLLPLLIFLWRRADRKTLVRSVLISCGLILIFGFPYVIDWGVAGNQAAHSGALTSDLFYPRASSIALLIKVWDNLGTILSPFARWDPFVRQAMPIAVYLIFAIFYAIRCWRLMNIDAAGLAAADVVHDVVLFHFVFICFVHAQFYTWYFGMFLPLALLLPATSRLRQLIVVTSCVQVFALTGVGEFFNEDLSVAMKLVPLFFFLSPAAAAATMRFQPAETAFEQKAWERTIGGPSPGGGQRRQQSTE